MKCRKCGREIPEWSDYCPYCGARTPRGTRKRALVIFLALVALLELAAIAGLYVMYVDVCRKYENLLYYGFKTVKLAYAVDFGREKVVREITIRARDYIAYFERSHYPRYLEDYASFVTSDDPYIVEIAGWFSGIWDPEERADAVLSLCQISVAYEENTAVYYPLETIVRGSGACDEKSLLCASILKALGYDVVLIAYVSAAHMNVGVHLPFPPRHGEGYYVVANGERFYVAETTAAGFMVGDMPLELRNEEIVVIPV